MVKSMRIRKARNAVGAKRKRGVRRRRLQTVQLKRSYPNPGAYAAGYGAANMVANMVATRRKIAPPRVRRRRPGAVGGRTVGGDISFKTLRWKRSRMRVWPAINQLVKSREYQIERCQGMRRMNSNNDGTTLPGWASLLNTYDLGTGSLCPLDLFDLTAVLNNNLPAPTVAYSMSVLDNGNISWSPRWTQSATGSTLTNGAWEYERSSRIGSTSVGVRYITHEWFDIRLNLYGCNTQPTYYDIMLVTLKSDVYDPFEVQADAQDERKRQLAYLGMVKTLMFNPINPGDSDWSHGFNVLRRYRKVFQPSSPFGSDDVVDKNPHNHVLKIKYVMKRTLDYQQYAKQPPSDTVALGGQWVQTFGTIAELQNVPRSRAKLFLLVRAMNTTRVTAENSTAANTPSYDFCIRRKITYSS